MAGFHFNSNYRPPIIQQEPEEVLWCDKRRPFFGMDISFTKYTLYPERLVIQTGFLHRKTEELRLYRILDVTLKQTFGQRLWSLGSIVLQTGEATSPKVFVHDIRDSEQVYRLLSNVAEQQRRENRIGIMECFDGI